MNERTHVPVTLRCRVTTDRGVFRKQYQGVKINELSPLHPFHHFREKALTAAKMWVQQMGQQGKDLLSAEGDILVSGPYATREFKGAATPSWAPADGMGKSFQAHGREDWLDPQEESADFILSAMFLEHNARKAEVA